MPRDESGGVFSGRRADPDWEMFRRGGTDAAQPWVDAAPAEPGAGPVALEPDEKIRHTPAPPGHAQRPRVGHFHTRIVGVAYPNADGTSRREPVRALRRMQRVRLAHRPDNPADVNAVAVLRDGDGFQLGYLPATVAKDVVAAAREGTRYLAVVDEVTGAGPYDLIAGGTVGATLLVLTLDAGATLAQARQYLLDLMNAS